MKKKFSILFFFLMSFLNVSDLKAQCKPLGIDEQAACEPIVNDLITEAIRKGRPYIFGCTFFIQAMQAIKPIPWHEVGSSCAVGNCTYQVNDIQNFIISEAGTYRITFGGNSFGDVRILRLLLNGRIKTRVELSTGTHLKKVKVTVAKNEPLNVSVRASEIDPHLFGNLNAFIVIVKIE